MGCLNHYKSNLARKPQGWVLTVTPIGDLQGKPANLSDIQRPWAMLRDSKTPILGFLFFHKAQIPPFCSSLNPTHFPPITSITPSTDQSHVLLTSGPKQASTTSSFGEKGLTSYLHRFSTVLSFIDEKPIVSWFSSNFVWTIVCVKDTDFAKYQVLSCYHRHQSVLKWPVFLLCYHLVRIDINWHYINVFFPKLPIIIWLSFLQLFLILPSFQNLVRKRSSVKSCVL